MALTQSRNTPERDGKVVSYLLAAGAKIYSGALVALNASGYAVPGITDLNLTALGRAEQSVDNTNGANGGASIEVRRGVFRWRNSTTDPVSFVNIGKTCYIQDDETIAKTNGGNTRSAAGKLIDIDTGAWVEVR